MVSRLRAGGRHALRLETAGIFVDEANGSVYSQLEDPCQLLFLIIHLIPVFCPCSRSQIRFLNQYRRRKTFHSATLIPYSHVCV